MEKKSLGSLTFALQLRHRSCPYQASNLREMDQIKIIKLKENQTILQQECVLTSHKRVEKTAKKEALPRAS